MHDAATDAPGSFEQTVAGIDNVMALRPAHVDTGMNVTIVRGNVDHLLPLTELAIAKGFSKINFQFTTPFGRAYEDVVPPLDEAARAVMAVIDRYAERIQIHVINAQFCAFPGYEQYVVGDLQKLGRTMIFAADPRFPEQVNLYEWLGAKREKREVCTTCPWTTVCEGFQVFAQEKPDMRVERARPVGGGGVSDDRRSSCGDQWCEYADVLDRRDDRLRLQRAVRLLLDHRRDAAARTCRPPAVMAQLQRGARARRHQGRLRRRRADHPAQPAAAGALVPRPRLPLDQGAVERADVLVSPLAEEASDAGINEFHISFMAHTDALYEHIMGKAGRLPAGRRRASRNLHRARPQAGRRADHQERHLDAPGRHRRALGAAWASRRSTCGWCRCRTATRTTSPRCCR